jgi:hypothetical protein
VLGLSLEKTPALRIEGERSQEFKPVMDERRGADAEKENAPKIGAETVRTGPRGGRGAVVSVKCISLGEFNVGQTSLKAAPTDSRREANGVSSVCPGHVGDGAGELARPEKENRGMD